MFQNTLDTHVSFENHELTYLSSKIHEKYQKLRDELEKKFKEEIEKAKTEAAAELAPAPDGELGYHVGVGSTAPGGVGSSAPAGTTHTDPDTSADGGQAAPDPDFS